MSERMTGNLITGGGWIHEPTPQQMLFADTRQGWLIAPLIRAFTNSESGGRWFSRWSLGSSGSVAEAIGIGQSIGLWDKNRDKDYWKHNKYTWPWINRAEGMHDAWARIDPKTLTQADYDAHDWWKISSTNNAAKPQKDV